MTRYYYKKAKLIAQKKNKKLIVIGDPCQGNMIPIHKIFNNCEHGDITVDLFGCEKCDKMNINNLKDWKKYESNKYVVFETATLSFGKDLKKILKEIKRISGGDFFSSGGTTTILWKYIGRKIYSINYKNKLKNMIYKFDSLKDKYYYYFNFSKNRLYKIDWSKL